MNKSTFTAKRPLLIRRQSGFGLLEVMIAAGILGVITLSISSVVVNANKQQKRIEYKDASLGYDNQIQGILKNPLLCADGILLAGPNPNQIGLAVAAGTLLPVNRLRLFQVAPPVDNTILTSMQPAIPGVTSGLTIGQIDLRIDSFPGTGAGTNTHSLLATLIIPYNMTDATQLQMPARNIGLFLVVDDTANGQIKSCGVAATDEGTLCTNLLGGTYNNLNTPKCSIVGQSLSAANTMGAMGMTAGAQANVPVLAVDSNGPTARGINVYGSQARMSFYPNVADFQANAATGGNVALNGANIDINPPGGGSLQVNGNGAVSLALTSGSLTTGPFHTTANAQVDGNLNINGSGGIAGRFDVTGDGGFGTDVYVQRNFWTGGGAFISNILTANNGLNVNNANLNIGKALYVGGTGSQFVGSVNFGSAGSVNSGAFNGTSFTTASDRRLKENISPLGEELANLLKIKTYRYNYIKGDDKKSHLGVIAQEIQSIYPELVNKNNDGMLGVNYSELVPVLIKSVQELSAMQVANQKQIEALQAQIKALQSRAPAAK